MSVTPAERSDWKTARGSLSVARPLVVGILTVTPDSFFDGGRHAAPAEALARAERLIQDGAALLDVGAESTRPGATPVPADIEIARLVPIIEALTQRWPDVPLSVDTMKADVARAALDAGAAIINDVTGLRHDAALGGVVAGAGAGIVLMHSSGPAGRLADYELADYPADVTGAVIDELQQMRMRAQAAGIKADAIVLDPGLGFAKRTEHSASLLRELPRVVALGAPVLVGPSRKRFIGELSGGLPPEERLAGTIAACVVALAGGARLFRVHDVREVKRALDVATALGAGA